MKNNLYNGCFEPTDLFIRLIILYFSERIATVGWTLVRYDNRESDSSLVHMSKIFCGKFSVTKIFARV